MLLKDNTNFKGVFSIKTTYADGSTDEYIDRNLIMDLARNNMANLVGGVNSGVIGAPIDKIVLGTRGHKNNNILDYINVGELGFDTTRTTLFSEVAAGAYNYRITFNATGDSDVTVNGTGRMYSGATAGLIDSTPNIIQRIVSQRAVTYIVDIPASNGNTNNSGDPFLPYTEAALYANGKIFAMKTYPGRVKEDTVKFTISWSIIF